MSFLPLQCQDQDLTLFSIEVKSIICTLDFTQLRCKMFWFQLVSTGIVSKFLYVANRSHMSYAI